MVGGVRLEGEPPYMDMVNPFVEPLAIGPPPRMGSVGQVASDRLGPAICRLTRRVPRIVQTGLKKLVQEIRLDIHIYYSDESRPHAARSYVLFRILQT